MDFLLLLAFVGYVAGIVYTAHWIGKVFKTRIGKLFLDRETQPRWVIATACLYCAVVWPWFWNVIYKMERDA